MKIEVEKAEKQHSTDIVNILLAGWLYAYPNDQYLVTVQQVRDKFGDINEKINKIGSFIESIRASSYVNYLIAKIDTKVVGFLYARKMSAGLYIDALYVDPIYHRTGIGSSLLCAVATLNHNSSHITVDVVTYNEQAISFYQKYGFVIQGQSQTPFGQFSDRITVPEIRIVKNLTKVEI